MDRRVAETLKMPSRKSLDLDKYYKFIAESTGAAYERLQKSMPQLMSLDEEEREQQIVGAIKQSMNNYRSLLQASKIDNLLKPYRFKNLFDTPTPQEKAEWRKTFGALKIHPGIATGFRIKSTPSLEDADSYKIWEEEAR